MCPVDEAKKRDIGLSDLLWSWTAYELGHQDKKEEVGGGHKGGGNERGTNERKCDFQNLGQAEACVWL